MKPNEQKTIELFLRACPTDAVRAVVNTAESGWQYSGYLDLRGRRCLLGVAAGVSMAPPHWARPEVMTAVGRDNVEETFDACCRRDGLSATVAEVRRLARGVLADRSAKG